MKSVNYNNLHVRIVVSFLVSVFIVLHGHFNEITRALKSPGFYFALTVSFLIALLLVSIIHTVTLWLDKEYQWHEMFAARAIWQFILGVCFPAIIDLLLITIYFIWLDQDIISNGFLLVDFPPIFLFICLFNMYYVIYYYHLTGKEIIQSSHRIKEDKSFDSDAAGMLAQLEHRLKTTKSPDTFIQSHKGITTQFKTKDVLYFCRQGRKVNFATKTCQDYQSTLKIATLIEKFEDAGFIQINRGMIVNPKIIRSVVNGENRNTLQLIIKEKYQSITRHVGISRFQLTKDYISNFNERFLGQKEILK